MRKFEKKLLISFLIFSFLSPLVTLANALPGNNLQNQKGIQLLSPTNEGVTFEVRLPMDKLIEKTISIDGKEYVDLSIPGWSEISQEGEPELPMIVENIAVPLGADLEVSVTPGKKNTRVLSSPLLPVATQFVDWEKKLKNIENPQYPEPAYKVIESKAIYGSKDKFPAFLAEVINDGILRQQRVIGVGIYPIQYVPSTGELIIYESLMVTIKFNGLRSTPSQSDLSDSAVYEDLLQDMLINYETALQWREEPADLLLDSENRSLPWTPPVPGWRVKVREDGFYKLDYQALDLAGLPVDTLDPQTFQLFHLGSEIAIHVEGEGDGKFTSGEYLLFYGQGINSKYTADNVYWLTYGSTFEGLRMGTRDVTPGAAAMPQFYKASKHMEINDIYLSSAPGEEDLERWMWDYILTVDPDHSNWSHTFTLQNPYPGSANLEIMLLGKLQNAINPDHHVEVYLQNPSGIILIGEAYWDGITWERLTINLEPGLLQAGDNTILIECPADTGVGYDFVYVDWVSLDYYNNFTVVDDRLAFSYEDTGIWKYQLEGFTTDDVIVYDVTNPNYVEQLIGVSTKLIGTSYVVQFEDTISDPKKYGAMTAEKFLTVQEIEQDTPSSIYNANTGAEHLIITHGDFISQAKTLSDFREGQGLESVWVDVQDIYDEFNYGIVGVEAIRNFLAHTIENWVPYPSYVVLLGDGHYNPKGYNPELYDIWQESYIPPYLAPVDPDILETAADNRYVTLMGDDILPDMMLGRLPVNNLEEASAVIDKIMTYESNPPLGDWRQQVLAVTDNPDNAGNFYDISNNLLDCCLPGPFNAQKVYYKNTQATIDAARITIQDGINSGKLIINYIGHASTSQWASEGLFKRSDIDSLSNGDKMPIMLPMTCMDGYYINPGSTKPGIYPAIGETITRVAGKGAIASWSPTGLGNVSGHDILNRGFFEAVFQSGDGMLTLGSATQAGKIDLFLTGTNQDLMDTYLLFGDPATRIAFSFTAVNDEYILEEDSILEISNGKEDKKGILRNDIHPQNLPLTAHLLETVSNGQLEFLSDGSFTYTPNPNYFGKDRFTYYATDSVENSNIAVVEITILAVDEKIFLPLIQTEVD